jgi:glycosyltransferase involved in cell wall biosynthesis
VPGRPLRLLGVGNGKSIIFLRWAWRLAELGHEVHVASDSWTSRPDELEGLHVHDVTELEPLTRVPGVRRLRIGPALGNLAEELDVDLVHGHYLLPYGYWAASTRFHPLVMSPWNTDIFTYGRDRARGRERVKTAIENADAYVVSSLGNAEETVRLGAPEEKVHRIVWYVDLRPFGPENRTEGFAERFGWPADSLLVLSLRNYRQNTNLDVLVRAFARAHREVSEARLILAARAGPLKADIERLIESLGIGDAVAMHFAAADELPELCASCDLGVSIADTDATPASMIESMASGLPMIMGDAITIDEWITQGEGGEVVQCRDEDALTEALLKLLRDHDLRRWYGERNIAVVRERLPAPGPQLEELYREILDARA